MPLLIRCLRLTLSSTKSSRVSLFPQGFRPFRGNPGFPKKPLALDFDRSRGDQRWASGNAATKVCSGSLADIVQRQCHVRFTPHSGHASVQVGRPKSANSGRSRIAGAKIRNHRETQRSLQAVCCFRTSATRAAHHA